MRLTTLDLLLVPDSMNQPIDYKIDLEVCPVPLLLVAADGAIVRTNHRSDMLFGYDEGELAGQMS